MRVRISLANRRKLRMPRSLWRVRPRVRAFAPRGVAVDLRARLACFLQVMRCCVLRASIALPT